MKTEKRGISPVIATVLLVAVSVAAIVVLAGVIMPMIRTQLGQGKSCFELREYFQIQESAYSCYNTTTRLMIERGMNNYDVKGFVVSIASAGSSKRFDVYDNVNNSGIRMLDNSAIKIPNPGEAKTYVFSIANGTGVDISVLQKDDSLCEPFFYAIPSCFEVGS